jgi:hypothetical protein
MQLESDMDATNGTWRATGHPFSRHSYSLGVMAENTGEYVLPMTVTFPGGCANALRNYTGELHVRVPHYNPDTKSWRLSTAQAPSSFAWAGAAAYDPVSGKILIVGPYDVHIYDPVTFATAKIFDYFDSGIYGTLIAHPSGKFYYVGGCCPSTPGPFKVWEIVLNRTDFTRSTMTLLTTTGTVPMINSGGFAYDPDHDVIGTFNEGQFYAFHVGTRTWQSETMTVPSLPGLVLRNEQGHHAISYDTRDRAFIFMATNRSANYPLHTFAYRWGGAGTAQYTLTITTSGTGSGMTTGAGAYSAGTQVRPTATPAVGSTFAGWTGPCATPPVTMDADKVCTATFTLTAPPPGQYTLTITMSGTGSGMTTGAGAYSAGAQITPTATPTSGSTFGGWTGPCATPPVTMDANKVCTATFTLTPPPPGQYTLTIATIGAGSGTTTGAGAYSAGAQVTPTATPASGSTFVGWTGPCATPPVTMDANKVCTATFTLASSTPPAVSFCAEQVAKLGSAVVRCVDFSNAMDALVNWDTLTTAGTSTHLYDPDVTATPGSGSLHHRVRSYQQVKAENPSLTNGQAWFQALQSDKGVWQRWIGQPLKPGQDYYFRFRFRFSEAWKMQWGGGGTKVFGLDAGCRFDPILQDGKTTIPRTCDTTLGLPQTATRQTGVGGTDSMEFVTWTTTNWWPAALNKPNRAYPTGYMGSANWTGTIGLWQYLKTDWAPSGNDATEQTGVDANGAWDPVKNQWSTPCSGFWRLNAPDSVDDGHCVTYGAPDTWHTWTVRLRWSGNYFNTNPNYSAADAGTVTNGSAIITNVSDTTSFNIGAPVSFRAPSGEFPFGWYRDAAPMAVIVSKTANTITMSRPAAFSGSSPFTTKITGLQGPLRHDTLYQAWYDGKLIADFDPDAAPFRVGQRSQAECRAIQSFNLSYDDCHTGIDMIRDNRDYPQNADGTYRPGEPGSYWPVAPIPGVANDPGATVSMFNAAIFSYRRGRPNPESDFCEREIGTSAPEYNTCTSLRASGDDAAGFEAFLNHAPVDVFYDDWIVSTVPLPLTSP